MHREEDHISERSVIPRTALLQKAMDPPDPEVIEDALDLLIHMRALEKASYRGRNEPSFYGRLLASFSLSFDASVLIPKFAITGMLHEGILFVVLMDLQPPPILRPFGEENKFMEYTDSYYSGNNKDIGLGRKEVLYMGNFCAFQFWQQAFKNKWWLEQLKNLTKLDEHNNAEILLPNDEILNSLHRFRPKFLTVSERLRFSYDPYEHTCQLKCMNNDDWALEDEDLEDDYNYKKYVAAPFVRPYDFQTDEVARKFASTVKDMRMQLTEYASSGENGYSYNNGYHVAGGASMCRFFSVVCASGVAIACFLIHSNQKNLPANSFFLCRDVTVENLVSFLMILLHQLYQAVIQICAVQKMKRLMQILFCDYFLFQMNVYYYSDDTDLHFSSYLVHYYTPSRIIFSTSQTDLSVLDPLMTGMQILLGLNHPNQTIMSRYGDNVVPWGEAKCVLWFPRFGHDYVEGQKNLVQTFFNYLAIRIIADSLNEVHVILTMKNIRFSQLQVEKLGRDSFFFLKDSFPFDE